MRNVLIALAALTLCQNVARAGSAPKLELRTTSFLVENQDEVAPESFLSLGGFQLAGHFFVTPKLAVGIGYTVAFDVSSQQILFHGFDLSLRYYWLGLGTRVDENDPWVKSERKSTFAAYSGVFGAERSYQPAKDAGGNARPSVSGSLAGLVLGIETPISHDFDFNAELAVALLAAKSDTTRFFTHTLSIGIAYAL